MYIHTYICINIQEVHALQHTFWIVSRSNPPIRPMHLVESSCTLGSGFGTGIAPYHSSKPPTSESQQKLPMWKKTTRIFVGGFILIMFLKPRRNKRNVTWFYIFLFLLPFKTRHVFEKQHQSLWKPLLFSMFRIVNRLVVVDARGYRVARRQRVAPRNIAQHLKHIPLGSVGRFPNISHQYEGYQRKNAKKKNRPKPWISMSLEHSCGAAMSPEHEEDIENIDLAWFTFIIYVAFLDSSQPAMVQWKGPWNYHLGSVPTARLPEEFIGSLRWILKITTGFALRPPFSLKKLYPSLNQHSTSHFPRK